MEDKILYQERKEYETKIKNYQIRLNAKDEEIQTLHDKHAKQLETLTKDKNAFELKASQLVEIVKQYSKELSELQIQIESIETEKKALQVLNHKLNEKNNEHTSIIQQYKLKLENVNTLTLENRTLHLDIVKLQNENMDLKQVISQLRQTQHNIETRNRLLEDNEQRVKTMMTEMQTYQQELQGFKEKYTQMETANKLNTARAEESEKLANTLTRNINACISELVEWIESNMGMNFMLGGNSSSNNDNESNKRCKEIPQLLSVKNVNWSSICECLNNKQQSIYTMLHDYEVAIKERDMKYNDLINKFKELNTITKAIKANFEVEKERNVSYENEILQMKTQMQKKELLCSELLSKNEHISKEQHNMLVKLDTLISSELDSILRNNSIEGKDKLYEMITTTNKSSNGDNSVAQFEKVLSHLQTLFSFVYSIINAVGAVRALQEENKQLRNDLSSALNEIDKQNVMYNTRIDTLNEEYKTNLNKVIADNETNVQMKVDEFNKEIKHLMDMNKCLEKKVANLFTEIELKDIQINTQEQIISRKTKKLNESSSIDEGLIKSLESDKQKLINDNLMLINDNRILKQQLDQIHKEQISVN
jgi:chromosome segregation ATPase